MGSLSLKPQWQLPGGLQVSGLCLSPAVVPLQGPGASQPPLMFTAVGREPRTLAALDHGVLSVPTLGTHHQWAFIGCLGTL